MSQKCVLVITDGIGYKPNSPYNAFANARKPTYDWLFANVPYSLIRTYGQSVGLPEGQMGNSEVGHMSIGSGRVLYQDLVRIQRAIDSKELEQNPLLQQFMQKTQAVHLLGLMSDGGVHSHLTHFVALAEIFAAHNKRVFLHLITDGRDVLPKSALGFLAEVEALCTRVESVSIASVSGRYYAMDRDKRWERIQEAYNAIAHATPHTEQSPREYIESCYAKDITDEFIAPMCFGEFVKCGGFASEDGLLMSNFRSDRAREIITALGALEFSHFPRDKWFAHILTMCEYDESFTYPVLFTKQKPTNTLAEVLANAGKTQAHIAETEKYAHVTFFFNGGVEEPFVGESRVLIPSPKVATYDLQPQMSAPEVGEAVLKAMGESSDDANAYDFIVVNFANGDMVGHTGNYEAALKAVEAVDYELGRIVEKAKRLNYALVLTSDHGNCEEMKSAQGEIKTNHTIGDVWCFVLANGVEKVESGALNNIAPSVLKIMGLTIPKEMDTPLI
ncbi:2,3-bisphosphoglycerate-independent phosphoglycerate mutase [Helicobacter sp.]|uniref:2,3-bisphosphoglycerate-independent phosphoglycerate mutase n=1 Tax=Helicobacter sp. TaxID=218 RepID=UPI0025BF6E4A|nr:2,3-bisphosphoglycerate-independent phosphoglycerate mutase [Helicobacter sp.]MBR2495138.1 2,3-bisphosphoglycerate-independent phosphoglycerate mutase [Helicobacter sp.]